MCVPPGRDAVCNVPAWVERLAMPVWVTTSDGILIYLNSHAEELIGHPRTACVGHSCYLVISGRTPEGAPLCAPRCRVRRLAAGREAIAPILMRIAAAEGEHREVTVVVIDAGADQLVHCVVDAAHYARLREFIDCVARHATHGAGRPRPNHSDMLTPREREILALLARDLTQQEIASRLSLSYATVRNHVQHILAKLGVHSILEAVAISLIDE